MKTVTGIFAAAASVAALLAGASIATADDHLNAQEKALVEKAKEEGSVTLIHPIFSDRTSQNLTEGFRKRYGLGDDFEVNFLRKGTGATVAQVRQEIQAGKFTVDAILVHSPGFFDAAAERDAFLELDSGYFKDTEKLLGEAGQYARYPYVVTPFAYAFQPVWNTACPGMENINITSYADTVSDALKGKTIASDITKSFTYTNTAIALDEAGVLDLGEYWPKLKATEPLVEFRTEPKMQMVISCQAPLDMWNLAGRVYQNVLKQPDLKDKLKIGSYSDGLVLLGNQVAALKGSDHPNAAKLLIEYLLSEEGSEVYVEGEAVYSFREGFTPPEAAAPYLRDLTKEKLIGMKDWPAANAKYEDVRGEWQDTFR